MGHLRNLIAQGLDFIRWNGESKFELFGKNQRVFFRLTPSKHLSENCIMLTFMSGGGVMVWGCFGDKIAGDFIQIKGIMGKEKHYSILQRHAILLSSHKIGQNCFATK